MVLDLGLFDCWASQTLSKCSRDHSGDVAKKFRVGCELDSHHAVQICPRDSPKSVVFDQFFAVLHFTHAVRTPQTFLTAVQNLVSELLCMRSVAEILVRGVFV